MWRIVTSLLLLSGFIRAKMSLGAFLEKAAVGSVNCTSVKCSLFQNSFAVTSSLGSGFACTFQVQLFPDPFPYPGL